jgi:hypothetical protein
MNLTKKRLQVIIKEEAQRFMKESSREGHWYDAGYIDGSDGSDPKYMNNMTYMDGWETGNEDYEHDNERAQKSKSRPLPSSRRPSGRIHDVDEGTAYDDMPASWQQILRKNR